MFSLICIWINGWVNNRETGDLRRYRAHYDVTVMFRACHNQIFDCPVGVRVIEQRAIILSATVRSPTVDLVYGLIWGWKFKNAEDMFKNDIKTREHVCTFTGAYSNTNDICAWFAVIFIAWVIRVSNDSCYLHIHIFQGSLIGIWAIVSICDCSNASKAPPPPPPKKKKRTWIKLVDTQQQQ